MKKINHRNALIIFLIGIALFMKGISAIDIQWDLTNDKHYTLSDNTIKIIEELENPITIEVLLGGDLPANYQRLRSELTVVLNQLSRLNTFVQFDFVDPFADNANTEQTIKDLYNYGLNPEIEIDQENQSTAQTVVVPWLILNMGNKSSRVPLLQKNLGDTAELRMEQSIQQLEYNILDGIHKLLIKKKKRIAIIKSHGTSEDAKLLSFLQGLQPYYNLAPFDLKAFPAAPKKTLENLNRFDLLVVSNPKAAFSNEEKYIFDQYTRQGGSSLFFIDPVAVAQDSLFILQGNAVVYPINLELDELFFKYGVRLNKDIITDLYSAPIVLAQGENASSEYKPYPWVYHPLVQPTGNHPIGSAIGNVQHRFTSSIDTLKNALKKTILLSSSNRSKRKTPPFIIELKEATQPLKPSAFNEDGMMTAVLLEGEFPSLFANRIAPFSWNSPSTAKPARMALFSDGNIAENQLNSGEPLELGYDKWTNNLYANKSYLHNTVHYLIGEEERLNLRTKDIQLAFLDTILLNKKGTALRYTAFLLPLILLGLLFLFVFVRRKQHFRQ